MRVLVTGGAGFIGAHLTRAMLKKNIEPVVLDNFSTGSPDHVPQGVAVKEMDVRDKSLRQFVAEESFDAIVHLAGQTMVDHSIKEPYFDADVNVMGMVNLLEAAKEKKLRVVFSSTAAVYGNVPLKALPIKETVLPAPESFYGLTKVTAEKYLELYAKLFGLNYVVLRFANVYGPWQGDMGEGGVISIFAKKLARGENLTIYGDGKQTRDFIYAGDIAGGICAAIATKNVNSVYNLSTQKETDLNKLIDLLCTAAGKKIVPIYDKERPGDIKRSSLANEEAKQKLAWSPKVSLAEGLKLTYEYFRKN